LAGPAGPPGSNLRVIDGQAKAMCDASEVMVSAYCEDGSGSLHIVGSAGASCEADANAKAVGRDLLDTIAPRQQLCT
jgi:hypothetical protein